MTICSVINLPNVTNTSVRIKNRQSKRNYGVYVSDIYKDSTKNERKHGPIYPRAQISIFFDNTKEALILVQRHSVKDFNIFVAIAA